MDGSLVWKIGHPVVNAQDGFGNFVFIQHMPGVAHQAVDVRLGQAIYLAELAQNAAAAERAHRSHQGNVSGLITIENIIIYLVPLVPAEIDIKIRRRFPFRIRSEEHTSELQSLMRISYAVFCLKNKKT